MDKKDVIFSVITPNDNDYSNELELRNEILWKTSGLNIYEKPLNENEDYHIIGKTENNLIACLLLTKINEKTLLMREVSVKKSLQGLGIGKMLTAFSEEFAVKNGYNKIEIHNARLNVVPFYEKQGYSIVGDEFIQFGIKRRKMEKKIK